MNNLFLPKVLLVDDREENLYALEMMLSSLEVRMERAESGNAALEKLRAEEFALILLDVHMPGLDGYETLRLVRQESKHCRIPVIFLSAVYNDDLHILKGIEDGAVDYLNKPIVQEILLGKVNIFLSMYNNEKVLERELAENKILSDLARRLIEPEISIQCIACKVFDAALQLADCEHGFVSEIDPDNGDNVRHTFSEDGEYKRFVFPCGGEDSDSPARDWPFNTGEVLMTNDLMSHPAFKGIPDGHMPLKDLLMVPVVHGGDLIGEIAMTHARRGFQVFHKESLKKLADLYAIAIHRNREDTRKRKLEAEARQSEYLQVIGQLAGGMAHNFNNILNGIVNSAELLEQKAGDGNSDIKKYTDIIVSSSMRATGIIKELLKYSNVEEYGLKKTSPDTIVHETIRTLQASVGKDIQLYSESAEDLWDVYVEAQAIKNVLINLGMNASHAIEEKGSILFTLNNGTLDCDSSDSLPYHMLPGDYVRIDITDSGCGMDDSVLSEIFKPFFTTKPNSPGLGLSVSYRIIKNHKGYLLAESVSGEGSCFSVYLPALGR